MCMRRRIVVLSGLLALGCPGGDDGATGGSSSSGSESSSSAEGSSTGATTTPSTTTEADTSSSGSSSGESSTGPGDSSESTGTNAVCGNGELEEGEGCDDGDTEDGDACRADCTPAFEVVWTQLHDGEASSFDEARAVWIDDADDIFVFGSHTTTRGGADAWGQQYLPDGTLGQTFSYDDGGSDEYLDAVAIASNGDFLTAGASVKPSTDYDAMVIRIEGLDSISHFELIDGPGMGPGANDDYDLARTVLGTADAGFVMAGHFAVDDSGLDMFLARFDGLDPVWTTVEDDGTGLDNTIRALLPGPDDRLYAFGNDVGGATTAGFVRIFDQDGTWLSTLDVALDFTVDEAVRDAEGNFVVSGGAELGATLTDAVVRKYDPMLAEIWAASFDGSGDLDFASGVHVGADGNVYLVGTTYRRGEQANGFLQVFDGDGNPLWGDEHNTMDVDLGEQWFGVATDSVGDVVVVGSSTILGQQTDAFVRKYHPL